jgi:DNA-binding CsgD family transcriptional regulator
MDPRDYSDEIKRRRGKGNRRRTEPKDAQKQNYIRDREDYNCGQRALGRRPSELARELGISEVQVRLDIKNALARIGVDNAQELRAVEHERLERRVARGEASIARLDAIIVEFEAQAKAGDPDAADIVVKAEQAKTKVDNGLRQNGESLRKLFGLDAPTKTELTGKDGGPIDVVATPEAAREAVRQMFNRVEPPPVAKPDGEPRLH